MYFLAASMGEVSDCNQFVLECSNTRASTHGTRPHRDFQLTGESITQHAGNSCKLPLQRYNNRLLLSAYQLMLHAHTMITLHLWRYLA